MIFHVISSQASFPTSGQNAVYLKIDNWNDYSFITAFGIMAFDENGRSHPLNTVRIGFVGQTTETATYEALDTSFDELPEGFFSLGDGVEYYSQLSQNVSPQWLEEFLIKIRDVVKSREILKQAEREEVFRASHLRGVSIGLIRKQFTRVLNGDAVTTDFEFEFELPVSDQFAGFDLEFTVTANSRPSSNIHALIGRNGVGKTTILNSMVKAISQYAETEANFNQTTFLGEKQPIGKGYFSSLVSVAFSAFDPFNLSLVFSDEDLETPYTYIGLTASSDEGGARLKSQGQIHSEFVDSLKFCLSDSVRGERWQRAVKTLESDGNFANMELLQLCEFEGDELEIRARHLFKRMSSGHAIVILTLTQLVERVQEKTLVLFDEPESHLHPPLLSALIRSLSQLLHNRNAIAVIATHSPVVLQEIPKSCVWKVFREGASGTQARPETETFGENVGTLTREIFGLEVVKSGFHTLLEDAVLTGKTYDEILSDFGGCLGFEAKGLLRAMVSDRDEGLPI